MASMNRAVIVLAFVLLPLVGGAPSRVAACWDGYRVQTPHLTVEGDDPSWSLERAREVATWAPRIEALLTEAGLEAAVYYDVIELSDGADLSIRKMSLDGVFIEIARHLGVSRATRRRALAAPPGLTVQVAATRDRARAEALAAQLNDWDHPDGAAGAHGIYEAGGFPAQNETAHVVTELDADEREVHRILIGIFLDRTEAERIATAFAARSGTTAFARRLSAVVHPESERD